jgi:hypothetical protein
VGRWGYCSALGGEGKTKHKKIEKEWNKQPRREDRQKDVKE